MQVVRVFFSILIVVLLVVIIADTFKWGYKKIRDWKMSKKKKDHQEDNNKEDDSKN